MAGHRPASTVAWLLLAVLALKAPGLLAAALGGIVAAVTWLMTAPGGTAVLATALVATLTWCVMRPMPIRHFA
jgi:hypothetical protein